jgi:GH15 family glucan-1,4-alpha-glucosidase
MASRIEDYALIGDCETAALVSKDGSIDWLCWPRFDSAACFAALLGDVNNGRWQIAPVAMGTQAKVRVKRRYWRNTLILETEFTIADRSTALLIDFMPLREGRAGSRLVRLVVGKRGTVPMRTELIVRFGYGGWTPWVTRNETSSQSPAQICCTFARQSRLEASSSPPSATLPCRPASGCRSFSHMSHHT